MADKSTPEQRKRQEDTLRSNKEQEATLKSVKETSEKQAEQIAAMKETQVRWENEGLKTRHVKGTFGKMALGFNIMGKVWNWRKEKMAAKDLMSYREKVLGGLENIAGGAKKKDAFAAKQAVQKEKRQDVKEAKREIKQTTLLASISAGVAGLSLGGDKGFSFSNLASAATNIGSSILKTVGDIAGSLGSSILGVVGDIGGALGGAMLASSGALAKFAKIGLKGGLLAGGVVAAGLIIKDAVEGYYKAQEWGVSTTSATIGAALGGTDKGWMNAAGQAGKWGAAGAAAGMMFPPFGVIVGGVVGALAGGIAGYFGGKAIAEGIDGVASWAHDTVTKIFGTDKYDEDVKVMEQGAIIDKKPEKVYDVNVEDQERKDEWQRKRLAGTTTAGAMEAGQTSSLESTLNMSRDKLANLEAGLLSKKKAFEEGPSLLAEARGLMSKRLSLAEINAMSEKDYMMSLEALKGEISSNRDVTISKQEEAIALQRDQVAHDETQLKLAKDQLSALDTGLGNHTPPFLSWMPSIADNITKIAASIGLAGALGLSTGPELVSATTTGAQKLKSSIGIAKDLTSMDLQDINLDQLKQDEGFRSGVYEDTMGIKTVGYGFNLERAGAQEALDAAGIKKSLADLKSGKVEMTEEEADRLMRGEYPHFADAAKRYVGAETWKKLSLDRQKVLTNMVYNMGEKTINKFSNLRKAIQAGDWQEAGAQMLDSRWAKQVKGRSTRLMKRMTGTDTPDAIPTKQSLTDAKELVDAETEMSDAKSQATGASPVIVNNTVANSTGGDTHMIVPQTTRNTSANLPNNNVLQPG